MESLKFHRGMGVKESLDIGDKTAQYVGKMEKDARRLGLVKSPESEVGNLFPEDSSFKDIAQWVLPNDKKSGILFCQYTEFDKEGSTAPEFHVLMIHYRGNGEWDEYQGDYDDAMKLLNRFLSWNDIVSHIKR